MKAGEKELAQVIDLATQMILAGTLLKNVKRHFINLGINECLSDKICRISELNANELRIK